MRARHKEWKNGKYPKWTCRIIWFEEGDGENIRLHLEDSEMIKNVYPESKAEADAIWEMFRSEAPPNGGDKPIVAAIFKEFYGSED